MRASRSSATPCTTWRMSPKHVGVQAAEIGDAGGGAHAAEEAVALDQQGLAARCAAAAGGGGDAGGPAAEDDDFVVAADRRVARGFKQREGHALRIPGKCRRLTFEPRPPFC